MWLALTYVSDMPFGRMLNVCFDIEHGEDLSGAARLVQTIERVQKNESLSHLFWNLF